MARISCRQGETMVKYMKTVCGRIAADVRQYGMAGAALLLYTVVVNLVFHAFCPLVIFCGLPCPGCGITRATVCFMTGRWQQAWQLNPVIFPIMAAMVYFAWNRYLLGRKARGLRWILVLIAVLLIGAYLVRMDLYFPDREPYVYTEDNMMAHFYTMFQTIKGAL